MHVKLFTYFRYEVKTNWFVISPVSVTSESVKQSFTVSSYRASVEHILLNPRWQSELTCAIPHGRRFVQCDKKTGPTVWCSVLHMCVHHFTLDVLALVRKISDELKLGASNCYYTNVINIAILFQHFTAIQPHSLTYASIFCSSVLNRNSFNKLLH